MSFPHLDYWIPLVFCSFSFRKVIFLCDLIVLLCTIYSLCEPFIQIFETYEKILIVPPPFQRIFDQGIHSFLFVEIRWVSFLVHTIIPLQTIQYTLKYIGLKRPEHSIVCLHLSTRWLLWISPPNVTRPASNSSKVSLELSQAPKNPCILLFVRRDLIVSLWTLQPLNILPTILSLDISFAMLRILEHMLYSIYFFRFLNENTRFLNQNPERSI